MVSIPALSEGGSPRWPYSVSLNPLPASCCSWSWDGHRNDMAWDTGPKACLFRDPNRKYWKSGMGRCKKKNCKDETEGVKGPQWTRAAWRMKRNEKLSGESGSSRQEASWQHTQAQACWPPTLAVFLPEKSLQHLLHGPQTSSSGFRIIPAPSSGRCSPGSPLRFPGAYVSLSASPVRLSEGTLSLPPRVSDSRASLRLLETYLALHCCTSSSAYLFRETLENVPEELLFPTSIACSLY